MLLKEWENEKETLHLLSQILGKYKLECSYQEPQWEHVILDITVEGFTTGMLHYKDKDFYITVNLIDHVIEIRVDRNKESIELKNGLSIQYYYSEIKKVLEKHGLDMQINTTPQEFPDTTPFEKDSHHHHYDSEISGKVLDLMKFAYHAEAQFISSLRTRRVKPGLFWGTFDISSIIVYNSHQPFEDDSKIIERAAFDEEMIEFGFWFGDDNFKGPTFFVLPYPFADKKFECNDKFPEGSYFDENLGEFIIEVSNYNNDTIQDIVKFFYESYSIFKDDLEWKNCEHFHLPLKMKGNNLK